MSTNNPSWTSRYNIKLFFKFILNKYKYVNKNSICIIYSDLTISIWNWIKKCKMEGREHFKLVINNFKKRTNLLRFDNLLSCWSLKIGKLVTWLLNNSALNSSYNDLTIFLSNWVQKCRKCFDEKAKTTCQINVAIIFKTCS